MMAIRINTDVTSNGSRKSRNNRCPTACGFPNTSLPFITIGPADGDAVQPGEMADHPDGNAQSNNEPRDTQHHGDTAGMFGALFHPGVQQHDDKDEQHHHRAGIDNDLHGGHEFRAQQQVQQGQRTHHHNQRQGAVDGVLLHQQVDRPTYTQRREDEEENKRQHGYPLRNQQLAISN